MKRLIVCYSAALVASTQALAASPQPGQPSCPQLYAHASGPAAWRKASTNAKADGSLVATSPEREAQIQSLQRVQQNELNDEDVPMMYLVPGEGVLTKELKHATGDDSDHTIESIVVGNVPNGRLPVSVLAPVSAHFPGWQAAAKTDKFTIEVRDSAGHVTRPIQDAPSLDNLTVSETEIPLEKGKTVRVTYERTGSGSGGYRQGRTVEIKWDPDNEANVTDWDDKRSWIDKWEDLMVQRNPQLARPKAAPASPPAAAAWRTANTHLSDNGGAHVKTSDAREKKIKQLLGYQQSMWDAKDVPMAYFVPEDGVMVKELKHATGLDNDHTIEEIVVGNVPNGQLPVTVMAPVSGHFPGWQAAAKTDKYTIEVRDASGKITTPVKDAQSLDKLTLSEAVIQLQKGQTVEVTYHRTGSGPGGYPQGRTVRIKWDPDNEANVTGWDDKLQWMSSY